MVCECGVQQVAVGLSRPCVECLMLHLEVSAVEELSVVVLVGRGNFP